MNDFVNKFNILMQNFDLLNILDIFLISLIIYFTFKFLIKNNSMPLIKIFIIIILASLIVNMAGLLISEQLVKYFLLTAYIAFVVIYSSELKRGIWSKIKKRHFDKYSDTAISEEELKNCTEEIIKAVQNMAKKDIGALILFVNNQPPAGILESGIMLNGHVSSQLLESIFIPKSPLHDGAVLIKGNKILGAGCFLPLSLEINLPKEFGTRHRAAKGITEMYDVMAIVVSEETGIISIAKNGELKRYIDGEMLKDAIEEAYGLTYKTKI